MERMLPTDAYTQTHTFSHDTGRVQLLVVKLKLQNREAKRENMC